MHNSNSVIIFVQASRDIVHALQLIEEYRNYLTTVFVVDHFSNFQVLRNIKSLPPNVTIKFIKNYRFGNPFNVVFDAIRLRSLYLRNFLHLRNSKVFFFSNYFDYKTIYFVSSLSKRNTVSMVDHYGLERSSVLSYKYSDYLRQFLIWLITFKKCEFTGEAHVPTFKLNESRIDKIQNVSLCNDLIAKYKTKFELSKKSVIIFDMSEPDLLFTNYNLVLSSTIEIFIKAGFQVYIKPHPRAETHNLLLQIDRPEVHLFQSNMPSELVDLSAFDYAVAAISAAVCGVSKKPISLIELLDFIDNNKRAEYKSYLKKLDSGIVFPQSFDNLLSV